MGVHVKLEQICRNKQVPGFRIRSMEQDNTHIPIKISTRGNGS